MKSRIKILLVEDDRSLGFLLVDFLESEKFEVVLVSDGEEAFKIFKNEEFDFCIFDVMLPGIDGFNLAKRVRAENKTVPIIFLTARGMKNDKLKGFDIGVDDYITKPFDEEELVARIHSILNRYQHVPDEPVKKDFYKIGNYSFDYNNQLLTINEQERRLTKKENDVLRMLCLIPGEIVKRDDILLSIWGDNDYFNGRSLDVFITKLRKYLAEDDGVQIINVPKVGYILELKE